MDNQPKYFIPVISTSELTNLIYVYTAPGQKYEITEQVISAMKATGRLQTVTEFADKCRECGKTKATGKWIDKGSLSCRCSRCGCKSPEETRYCPHCGSRNGGNDDK